MSREPGRDQEPPSPGAQDPAEITRLLGCVASGDQEARNELASLVHPILVEMAARIMARQPAGHTLNPTALAHEAWMRIEAYQDGRVATRKAFYAVAGSAMRSILVDHVRAKRSLKRSPLGERVFLDDLAEAYSESHDLLDLEEALVALASHEPRLVRLVELRFFLGLTMKETADLLGISESTAYREWCFAQTWIRAKLA